MNQEIALTLGSKYKDIDFDSSRMCVTTGLEILRSTAWRTWFNIGTFTLRDRSKSLARYVREIDEPH